MPKTMQVDFTIRPTSSASDAAIDVYGLNFADSEQALVDPDEFLVIAREVNLRDASRQGIVYLSTKLAEVIKHPVDERKLILPREEPQDVPELDLNDLAKKVAALMPTPEVQTQTIVQTQTVDTEALRAQIVSDVVKMSLGATQDTQTLVISQSTADAQRQGLSQLMRVVSPANKVTAGSSTRHMLALAKSRVIEAPVVSRSIYAAASGRWLQAQRID